jgi:hypothetical protein
MDNDPDNNEDVTDEFGCASNIEASNISYNVDDYDIIDDEDDAKDVAAASASTNHK